jgi:hypothetical protein
VSARTWKGIVALLAVAALWLGALAWYLTLSPLEVGMFP